MSLWSIEPRDMVMFRDARPFSAGASAYTMPIAWPSTTTGFVRSKLGTNNDGQFVWTTEQAKQLAVRGPWIVALNDDGEVKEHYFQCPADVLFQSGEDGLLRRYALHPKQMDSDAYTSLPNRLWPVDTAVSLNDHVKPPASPSLWSWTALKRWLEMPSPVGTVHANALGISYFDVERRVHVSIDPKTRTAKPGELYQTSMLRMERYHNDSWQRYALAVDVPDLDESLASRLADGLSPIGGERRLAWVHRSACALPEMPDFEVNDQIIRLVLLTPGIFDQGWRPCFDDSVELIAAATGRPQAISGWSFEHNQPKKTRYMVPAGSVYWVKVAGDALQWAKDHHFQSICDQAQDRLDGFGLVAVGRGVVQ